MLGMHDHVVIAESGVSANGDSAYLTIEDRWARAIPLVHYVHELPQCGLPRHVVRNPRSSENLERRGRLFVVPRGQVLERAAQSGQLPRHDIFVAIPPVSDPVELPVEVLRREPVKRGVSGH